MSPDSAVSYKLWRLEMAEWWDNLKEEIYWPYNQARNWFEIDDNRFGAAVIAITTAVLALFIYFPVFFGGRRVLNALNEETTITVVSGNPCLTEKGLVKTYAPPPCYVDKMKHELVETPKPIETLFRNNDESVTPSENAYNPPCKKDGLPGCTDQIYSKRLVEGEIFTATFNSDEKQESDGHLQPDYTEVAFLSLDDSERPNNEKFCGNVLDHFTPGRKFKMVINESKQSDYNGCYVIDVVQITFGGDYYRPARRK
jgi:hypothetical protein